VLVPVEEDMVEQVAVVVDTELVMVDMVVAEVVVEVLEEEVAAAAAAAKTPIVRSWYYPRQRIRAGPARIVQSIPAILLSK